jgi:pimeloyl-ACP methyl ester carboxylesterase
LATVGLSGCVTARYEACAPAPPPEPAQGIVFSVDGAGGFHGTSTNLRRVVSTARVPLRVETVDWSHGWGRVVADQTDYAYARSEGQRLAGTILAAHAACPDLPVYLIAHSAGSAVALAAVEALPPATVERVVLLAPALSTDYDLRPALSRVRCGIDVFCSERDWFYLGLGTGLLGTSDRRWSASSGRVGFHPVGVTSADHALYGKLRQHPWHPSLAWTGNEGGHSGASQPAFLRAYVLPLLQPAGSPSASVAMRH